MLRVNSWRAEHRRTGRVLRASRSSLEGGPADSERDSGLRLATEFCCGACCRVCWGEERKDEVGGGGELVVPCKCSGSMKYIHLKCLSTWQSQLRKQKGRKAALYCDVCKSKWADPFVRLDRPSKNSSNKSLPALVDRIQDFLQSLNPNLLSILRGWKAIALAQGFLTGIEAGVAGFRLGLRYHSLSLASRIHVGLRESTDAFRSATQKEFSALMKWSPLSLWAAAVMYRTVHLPTVTSLVPMIHLLFSAGLGLRGRLLALLGMYAGAIAGFYRGIASTTGATFEIALKLPGLFSSVVKSALHMVLKVLVR